MYASSVSQNRVGRQSFGNASKYVKKSEVGHVNQALRFIRRSAEDVFDPEKAAEMRRIAANTVDKLVISNGESKGKIVLGDTLVSGKAHFEDASTKNLRISGGGTAKNTETKYMTKATDTARVEDVLTRSLELSGSAKAIEVNTQWSSKLSGAAVFEGGSSRNIELKDYSRAVKSKVPGAVMQSDLTRSLGIEAGFMKISDMSQSFNPKARSLAIAGAGESIGGQVGNAHIYANGKAVELNVDTHVNIEGNGIFAKSKAKDINAGGNSRIKHSSASGTTSVSHRATVIGGEHNLVKASGRATLNDVKAKQITITGSKVQLTGADTQCESLKAPILWRLKNLDFRTKISPAAK